MTVALTAARARPHDDCADGDAARADLRLADRVRRGDERAFAELDALHRSALVAFARQITGSHHDAEDVVQQGLLRAFQALSKGHRPEHVRGWLYAIVRNRALTLRAAPVPVATEPGELAAAVAGVDDDVLRRADVRAVLRDIAALPEAQRTALVLTEMSGLPQRHIAEILGVDEQRVGGLVYQARRALSADLAARDASCQSIREQIAVARGGDLRRGPLRRHLRQCSACRAYRRDVERQRGLLGLALPLLGVPLRDASTLTIVGAGALVAPQPIIAPSSTGALATVAAKLTSLGSAGAKAAGMAAVPKAAAGLAVTGVLAAGVVGSGAVTAVSDPATEAAVSSASPAPSHLVLLPTGAGQTSTGLVVAPGLAAGGTVLPTVVLGPGARRRVRPGASRRPAAGASAVRRAAKASRAAHNTPAGVQPRRTPSAGAASASSATRRKQRRDQRAPGTATRRSSSRPASGASTQPSPGRSPSSATSAAPPSAAGSAPAVGRPTPGRRTSVDVPSRTRAP